MTPAGDASKDKQYKQAVAKGLDAALKRASEQRLDPAQRIAIFSDHHKGVGDPADDFRRCEDAYSCALGYYLEAGYRLFVIGDSEELWEEHPGEALGGAPRGRTQALRRRAEARG